MFELLEEQKALKDTLHKFAEKELRPRALPLDAMPEGQVDWDLIKEACKVGLFSGFLPRKYGGTLGGIAACIAMEELAAAESGFAMLIGAHGMGIAAVALSRDKELMDRFFPRLVESEKNGKPEIWACAITEPGAGSDVEDQKGSRTAQLTTVARKDGNRYILNGRKCFISNGNIADWVTVFATVDREIGIDAWTGFVVPSNAPGFSVSRVEDKMGQRACPNAELVFEDVEVPVENRIGEEKTGWSLIRVAFAVSRPTVAAHSVGIARGAYEIALKYATQRYQGGRQIIEHQMIQAMLADMATSIEAGRLMAYYAASLRPPSMKISSMAKVFASDMAVKVCTDAIQVMGGYGYMKDYGVEKYYRDAKVNQIMEGTNQVNRLAIMEGIAEEIGYSLG